MTTSRGVVFQLFKYAVYCLLTLNIFFFGREEYLAAQLQFSNGVAIGQLIEAYASTIDTAAWVVLLLMFELETYLLDDSQFTPRVTNLLHSIRFVCYAFIVYAFYGYIVNVFFVYDVVPATAIDSLCALADGQWSYAVDLDEYLAIDSQNCRTLGHVVPLMQLGALPAVVDWPGLVDIQRLAWVDVINAGVWILIVVVLEIDVRLQERGQLEGLIFRVSNALKIVFYSILFLAAIYWGIKGDFVDFWDAFLWLLAFFFIEMNVVEWRHDEADAHASAQGG